MEPRVDHIGIAVKEEGTWERIAKILGIREIEEKTVESEGLRVKFLRFGSTRIELLYPISPDSPVQKFLDKRGEGIHHIAIEVKNIEAIARTLQQSGYQLIDEKPRIGAEGYKAMFLHPRTTAGVLLELIEK